MRLIAVLFVGTIAALPVAAADAAPVHYAGTELGSLGSPLVFTVDGSHVSGLVYYGVPGNRCPELEGLRITLVGYKLPQTGTRQGDRINLVYEQPDSRFEFSGTLGGHGAKGTLHATVHGCDLGERQWQAVAPGATTSASRRKRSAPRAGRWVGTDPAGHAAVSFTVRHKAMSDVRVVSFLDCKDTNDTSLNLTSFWMRPTFRIGIAKGKFLGALIPGANFYVTGPYDFRLTVDGRIGANRAKGRATLALGRLNSPPDCYGKMSFTAQPLS